MPKPLVNISFKLHIFRVVQLQRRMQIRSQRVDLAGNRILIGQKMSALLTRSKVLVSGDEFKLRQGSAPITICQFRGQML
jgi:hypothetical protein